MNDCLARAGDSGCLAVLPLYRVRRALVRCKACGKCRTDLPVLYGMLCSLRR